MEDCNPIIITNEILRLREILVRCIAEEEHKSLAWYCAQRVLMHIDGAFEAACDYEKIKQKLEKKP